MTSLIPLAVRHAIGVLALSALAFEAAAQEMPKTCAEFYQAGERFAHCSAHFAFGARIARESGFPDNATAFEGMERGWRVAGLLLLAEGLDRSRQAQTQLTFCQSAGH